MVNARRQVDLHEVGMIDAGSWNGLDPDRSIVSRRPPFDFTSRKDVPERERE
jgi:hypothetical protein